VAFYVSYGVFTNDIALPNGWTGDIWAMGTYTGTALILVIMLKSSLHIRYVHPQKLPIDLIVSEFRAWNIVVHLTHWSAMLFYIGFIYIYADFNFPTYFDDVYYVLCNAHTLNTSG